MSNAELENIENQIIELTKSYFDLKQSSESSFIPNISAIPVSGKVLDSQDISNLVSSSLEGWLTSGGFTDKFQDSIRNFLGVRHCLFVNSGSSANLLALSGLKILFDIEDGSEVITSAVIFPTTLNPILQNNLKPILVDAEMGTYNIDSNLIEEKITPKTVGIVLATLLVIHLD